MEKNIFGDIMTSQDRVGLKLNKVRETIEFSAVVIIMAVLSFGILLVGNASAASVTIDPIPTICSSAVFRGNASYTVPDTLQIKLNGIVLESFSSGSSVWQVIFPGPFLRDNELVAQVSSSTAGIIASATQGFSSNCGNMDPMSITQSWGLTGYQTPLVPLGATVVDRFGLRGYCPFWMPKYLGCFDISNTASYIAEIKAAFRLR